jgi:hypothetical protein
MASQLNNWGDRSFDRKTALCCPTAVVVRWFDFLRYLEGCRDTGKLESELDNYQAYRVHEVLSGLSCPSRTNIREAISNDDFAAVLREVAATFSHDDEVSGDAGQLLRTVQDGLTIEVAADVEKKFAALKRLPTKATRNGEATERLLQAADAIINLSSPGTNTDGESLMKTLRAAYTEHQAARLSRHVTDKQVDALLEARSAVVADVRQKTRGLPTHLIPDNDDLLGTWETRLEELEELVAVVARIVAKQPESDLAVESRRRQVAKELTKHIATKRKPNSRGNPSHEENTPAETGREATSLTEWFYDVSVAAQDELNTLEYVARLRRELRLPEGVAIPVRFHGGVFVRDIWERLLVVNTGQPPDSEE